LLCDFSSRIMRTATVNDEIYRLKDLGASPKDIEHELLKKSCMANYGNFRIWRIDGIDFKKSPLSTFESDDKT